MKRLICLCLALACGLLFGQANFYESRRDEGLQAMARGDWTLAAERLEIAAFGMLDQPERLAELYLRLSIAHAKLNNPRQSARFAARALALLGEPPKKPDDVADAVWRDFLETTRALPKPAAAAPRFVPIAAADPAAGSPPDESPAADDARAASETALPEQASTEAKPEAVRPEPAPVAAPSLADRIRDAKALQRAEPDNPDHAFALAGLYLEDGQMGNARRLMRRELESYAQDPRYSAVYARYNALKGDHEKNIEHLSRLEGLNEEARYYLGLSYLETGRRRDAAAAWQGLDRDGFPELRRLDARLGPEAGDAEDDEAGGDRFAAIRRLVDGEDWTSARPLILAAYRETPRDGDAVYWRARLYLRRGEYNQALNLFQDLVNGGYRDGEVFYFGGLAALRDGDQGTANYMLSRAGAKGSEGAIPNSAGPGRKARIWGDRNLTRKIRELQERLDQDATDIAARVALTRLLGVTGDWARLKQATLAAKSLRLQGEQDAVLFGWELYAIRHWDKAIGFVARYGGDEAVFLRGLSLFQMGREDRARELLRSLQGSPAFPEIDLILKGE